MPSYGWAHIRIGGEYKGDFEAFEKVLKDEGLMRQNASLMDLQKREDVHDPRSSVEELGFDQENRLSIMDNEAENAELAGLESFCRDNGLSYVRHSSPCGEYDAETTYWVPGMDHAITINTDGDNDPVILLNTVRLAVEKAEDLEAFKRWLDENHPTIPDVPEFQIVA